jgi:ADP-heptose:LPS heptosyltransferase
MKPILVIKLGAFGDFVQTFAAFAAIRAHHAGQSIALLTTVPYRHLAEASPWFDEVLIDQRAPWWNVPANRRTIGFVNGFSFVYDLQTSRRTGRYYRRSSKPAWSGIAPGCSHPHSNPDRNQMHTRERQREQLLLAGVTNWPAPQLDWMIGRGCSHGLSKPFALLAPGCGGSPFKRWPVDRYACVALALIARGVTPVIIGGAAEAALGRMIVEAAPGTVDLSGRTSIEDVAALAVEAALVVGNDTGPVHLAALLGAPTIALFSAAGVPEQAAPRGPSGSWATVIQEPNLRNLGSDRVIASAGAMLGWTA